MNEGFRDMIDRLQMKKQLTKNEYMELIQFRDVEMAQYLAQKACIVREQHYGKKIYVRGLIEISNYCKNDCLYCGIRRSNRVQRYRMDESEILRCCANGYEQGFRTFVLQGGEDLFYTESRVAHCIETIKKKYPDCAITLSLGERSYKTYKTWYEAGADRYLLRHETANESLYKKLHPASMSLLRRKQCLWELKEIGYQVGAGFMVGSPYQTIENLAEDLIFLKQLQPEMVGIGPFLPAAGTPFEAQRGGSADLTCYLLSMVRLALPAVLLPSTTALSSASKGGRLRGIDSGANVVMPNISPKEAREKYVLYNKKIHGGAESGEGLDLLREELAKSDCEVVIDRGDCKW